MTDQQDALSKYVELYKEKKELSEQLKEVNKELRELTQIVQQQLEQTGQTLTVGDEQVYLEEKPRRVRKSQKVVREEVAEYLKNLGITDVESHVEALQKLKTGEAVVENKVCVASTA